MLCERCKLKPKYNDGKTVHPYCGRTCANIATGKVPAPANPPPPPNPSTIRSVPPAPQPTTLGKICRTPGCGSPVFVHPDGTPSNYCTVIHKDLGERGCISCTIAPMTDGSILCQFCHSDALSRAPAILRVSEDHRSYKSVESQFKRTWRHNTTCPEVQAVYKIILTEANLKQYQRYMEEVEARGQFVAQGKPAGNESRRWHGTKRKCQLGDIGHTSFCADVGCALCCIIKTSFDLKFFKAATGWGRFGHGIYTTSTSSKSNDYAKNIGVNSDWKALLLNKVVVGAGKSLINDDTSLTGPPVGYDSVVGEAAVGGSLNYDELVLYNNDAVRPSYLVMYKSP